MELNDVVEEDLGDGDGGVQVAQREEVGVLGEMVDHGQDHELSTDAREEPHKVHCDVGPHRTRQLEGLQEF
jgi:hypothetical protein